MRRTPEEEQADRGLQVMRELCRELVQVGEELRDATAEVRAFRADLAKLAAIVGQQAVKAAGLGALGKLFGR